MRKELHKKRKKSNTWDDYDCQEIYKKERQKEIRQERKRAERERESAIIKDADKH